MNAIDCKDNLPKLDKKQLIDCLHTFDSLLSVSLKGCCEKDILDKLQSIKELLKNANIELKDIDHRLEKCNCLGKQLFCLLSVIALECSMFLDALACADDKRDFELEIVFSLKQKQSLTQMLEFIVYNGIVVQLDFQISMLIPISQNLCHLSKRDLFNCCRHLVSAGSNDFIKSILISKHLLPLLAGLMQLIYSPNSSQLLSSDELGFCRKSLSNLIVKWSQLKDIVKCLFVIQGSSSRVNPLWINKACGSLLSKCLLRDNGVTAVISSLLLTLGDDASTWKKVEVASKLLSTPSRASNEKQYFYNICKQIFAAFQSQHVDTFKEDSDKVFLHILVATVMSLYKKSPALTTQFFFDKLFYPLKELYVKSPLSGDNVEDSMLDCCMDIGACIEILHTLLIPFKHPLQENVIKQILLPHFRGLFSLFCWSRSTVSHLQNLLKQILSKCLASFGCHSAACVLVWLCGVFDESRKILLNSILNVKDSLSFSYNDDENVVLQLRDAYSRTPEEVIDDQNKKVEATLELLSYCKVEKLPSRVFVLICKHIETLSEQMKSDENPNKLLTNDERAALHLHFGESQLLAYALLTSLCENTDPKQLFEDIDEITSFIKVLLTKSCNPNSDLEQATIRNDSLKLSFAVLGLCLLDTGVHQSSIKSLAPLLQKLSVLDHVTVEDREIASDLAVAIATHGAGGDVNIEAFSKAMQDQVKNLEANYSPQSKPSAVEQTHTKDLGVCDQISLDDSVSGNVSSPKNSVKPTEPKSELLTQLKADESVFLGSADPIKEAIASIYEPCPSSRAAGLRYIASAMKKGVAEMTCQADKLCDMLLEVLLKEDESFVYLSAIQALVETVNRAPMTTSNNRSLFDHLVGEYNKHIQTPGDDVELKAIKLGEIVVRIVEKLGDLADYQSSKLLPLLFRGSRDKRAPIRCSCLSNLAELCPLLRHKMSSFQFELRECVCATVLHDDDVTVRRSAIHVLRKLIESLGSDMLQIFSDSMKHFYSVMKHSYQQDNDHVVQLHAQLALESLDEIMRDVMFHASLNKPLEKKITILS